MSQPYKPGQIDPDTGQITLSTKTFLISMGLAVVLIVAAQFWAKAAEKFLADIFKKSPDTVTVWQYVLAATLVTILFIFLILFVLRKPEALFL